MAAGPGGACSAPRGAAALRAAAAGATPAPSHGREAQTAAGHCHGDLPALEGGGPVPERSRERV